MISPYPEKRPTIQEVRKRVALWTGVNYFSLFFSWFAIQEIVMYQIHVIPCFEKNRPRFEKNGPRKIKKDYKLLH